jgi:hypothetical protein
MRSSELVNGWIACPNRHAKTKSFAPFDPSTEAMAVSIVEGQIRIHSYDVAVNMAEKDPWYST